MYVEQHKYEFIKEPILRLMPSHIKLICLLLCVNKFLPEDRFQIEHLVTKIAF